MRDLLERQGMARVDEVWHGARRFLEEARDATTREIEVEWIARQLRSNNEFVTNGDVVASRDNLERERRIVSIVTEGLGVAPRLSERLDERGRRRLEQQAMLEARNRSQGQALLQIMASQHRVTPVVGPAGTGKSWIMSVMQRHLLGQMVTLAPTKDAVHVLKEGGIPATTVASFNYSGGARWGHGMVVVVDESSMIDNRAMEQLLSIMKARGHRMVLFGDPEQLDSPGVGDPFRLILNHSGIAPVCMDSIVRQEPDWYRRAVASISAGTREGVLAGFASLQRHNAVHEFPHISERTRALADRFESSEAQGLSVIALATTWSAADALNKELLVRGHQRRMVAPKDRINVAHWRRRSATEAGKMNWGRYVPGQSCLSFRFDHDRFRRNEIAAVVRVADEGIEVVPLNDRGEPDLHLRPTKLDRRDVGRFDPVIRCTTRLAVGDRLLLRANHNYTCPVRLEPVRFFNGEFVHIAGFDRRTLASGRTINEIVLSCQRRLPTEFRLFDAGYAVTAHKAQGLTRDVALCSFPGAADDRDTRVSRRHFYVGVSRGRKDIGIFTDRVDFLRDALATSPSYELPFDVFGQLSPQRGLFGRFMEQARAAIGLRV